MSQVITAAVSVLPTLTNQGLLENMKIMFKYKLQLGNNYPDDLYIGVIPDLEDVAFSVEGGQEGDLGGGRVSSELLT